MHILHSLLNVLKDEFAPSGKGEERKTWFLHTLLAIILPFTSSRTSCLLRVFQTLFGFLDIGRKRYYTFMASPKIPWGRLWSRLWKMIPEPETNGRLIVALDDYINPKTGKKIFGCANVFDHAAKQNQSQYPWRKILSPSDFSRWSRGVGPACPSVAQFHANRWLILLRPR